MNDMKEKAMGAVKAFLERKGYEIVDEAWQGPEGIGGIDLVAVDEDGTLRRRNGPNRDGRLPRGPQGARAARGAGGEVARRQRRRLRRHPGPLRRGGDDGRQGEPSAPSPPRQLLRRDGAALLGGAPGPGLPGPGFPPNPAPVPRNRTYTYVFVVHSACRTNPYGIVPTLRDSGRAGPDAARRAPR